MCTSAHRLNKYETRFHTNIPSSQQDKRIPFFGCVERRSRNTRNEIFLYTRTSATTKKDLSGVSRTCREFPHITLKLWPNRKFCTPTHVRTHTWMDCFSGRGASSNQGGNALEASAFFPDRNYYAKNSERSTKLSNVEHRTHPPSREAHETSIRYGQTHPQRVERTESVEHEYERHRARNCDGRDQRFSFNHRVN